MSRKRKPFTIVDNDILQDESMTIYEKMAYVILCCYADRDGICYPSYKTIAKKAGCSPRKAFDAVQSLEKSGLLIKQSQQNDNGRNGNNLYRIVAVGCAQDAKGIASRAWGVAPYARGDIAHGANEQKPLKQEPTNNQSIYQYDDGLTERLREHFERKYFMLYDEGRLHLFDTILEYMADMLTRPTTRIHGVDYSRDTISGWIFGANSAILMEFISHMEKQDLKGVSNLKGYYCTAMIEFFREYRILMPPLPYDDSS